MLFILYACERFDAYTYGRDIITVESDHKPLESIFPKESLPCTQTITTHDAPITELQP